MPVGDDVTYVMDHHLWTISFDENVATGRRSLIDMRMHTVLFGGVLSHSMSIRLHLWGHIRENTWKSVLSVMYEHMTEGLWDSNGTSAYIHEPRYIQRQVTTVKDPGLVRAAFVERLSRLGCVFHKCEVEGAQACVRSASAFVARARHCLMLARAMRDVVRPGKEPNSITQVIGRVCSSDSNVERKIQMMNLLTSRGDDQGGLDELMTMLDEVKEVRCSWEP